MGHAPPRTYEKITGQTDSFHAFCFFPFSGYARKEDKMNTSIKEETLGQRIRAQRIRMQMTQEEYDEDLMEIITVYKSLKDSKIKGIALEQMKLLATMSLAF